MTGSVLLYVQHLLGIGHLRRSLRIVEALAREGIRVTLISGGEPLSALACTSAERVIQLAPIRAPDAEFKMLVDGAGRPIDDELRTARRSALLDVFGDEQPDAVLIEAFPFGRRAFRFELDGLIEAARARRPRPLILCSLRDIVVLPSDPRRPKEIVDRVRKDFDLVLVHGDPAFIPLEDSFPLASEISDRLIYTGYIAEAHGAGDAAPLEATVGADEVVVSVGGGAVGGALLRTAIETRRRGCLANLRWRLLAGPNLPEPEFAALAAGLPDGVVLERYRSDFPQMLRRCRVSVSQAGYNTVLDILAARAAAVVVPFASGRETEQSFRAERLAARGVLELLPENQLSPEQLASAMNRAMFTRPATIAIDTGGALRSAGLIADMIRSPDREIGVRSGLSI
ncbi:MAG TPA: glycosyltransferase [Stellaceae bacterium]|jgi:predicted glycosyltransferase|nr:glycosyltransferase [Stellaceae bacterium]